MIWEQYKLHWNPQTLYQEPEELGKIVFVQDWCLKTVTNM